MPDSDSLQEFIRAIQDQLRDGKATRPRRDAPQASSDVVELDFRTAAPAFAAGLRDTVRNRRRNPYDETDVASQDRDMLRFAEGLAGIPDRSLASLVCVAICVWMIDDDRCFVEWLKPWFSGHADKIAACLKAVHRDLAREAEAMASLLGDVVAKEPPGVPVVGRWRRLVIGYLRWLADSLEGTHGRQG